MPFRSERQRRYLFRNHPEMAKRWADEEKRKKSKAGRKGGKKSGGGRKKKR